MAARSLARIVFVKLAQRQVAVRQMGQGGFERGNEIFVFARAHIMPIHAFELHEVEAGGRTADMRKVEGLDHLLCRKKFLVALAPAEPHQIIAQRLRQIAHAPDRHRHQARRGVSTIWPRRRHG